MQWTFAKRRFRFALTLAMDPVLREGKKEKEDALAHSFQGQRETADRLDRLFYSLFYKNRIGFKLRIGETSFVSPLLCSRPFLLVDSAAALSLFSFIPQTTAGDAVH